ncbi:MAG: hypothetical protein JWL97_3491, partial [Gemmatimonadales bacterium]|nr:hypothetical protein [Gemmatimonadales bacterium]
MPDVSDLNYIDRARGDEVAADELSMRELANLFELKLG